MVYDLQKASFLKRAAAWLLDAILVVILAVGIASLLSAVVGYDRHSDTVSDAYARYEVEYGVAFDVSQDEYMSWPEEKQQAYDAAYEALINDEDAMYAYNLVVNLSLLIASLSILVAMMGLEFVVPVLFKEGRTVGKRVFGLCVVRSDCVRMTNVQLFVRTLLGKFAVETMIPIYIIMMVFWGIMGMGGTLILFALLLAQIIILIANRRNAAIHDLMAGTAVVDYSSQMIFEDTQALIEYQKKIHAERAARQDY